MNGPEEFDGMLNNAVGFVPPPESGRMRRQDRV